MSERAALCIRLLRPPVFLQICTIATLIAGILSIPLHGQAPESSLSLDELKSSGWSRSRYQQHPGRSGGAPGEPGDRPQPRLAEYRNLIGPILNRVCIDCHGPSEQNGNIRIDTLDPNLHSGKDVDWWTDLFAAVSKGEMPPPDSTVLLDDERRKVVDWLSNELQTASIVRRQSASYSGFRRLTRYEYNYAMQDMLGQPWDFAKDLTPDAHSEDGFQNSSELLQMSVSQFETYHRLARTALSRTIALGEQPKTLFWGVTIKEASKIDWAKQDKQVAQAREKHHEDPDKLQAELMRLEESFRQPHRRTYFKNLTSGKTAVATWEYYDAKYANAPSEKLAAPPVSLDHVAVLPAGQWLNIELGDQLPDEGMLRVRVRAGRPVAPAAVAPVAPAAVALAAQGSKDQAAVTQQSDRTDGKSAGTHPPSLQLHFGWQASNEGRALLRASQQDTLVTTTLDDAQFYQWDIPLGEIYPRNSVRKSSPMGALPSPSEYVRLVNSSASPNEIVIDYVEVQAPVFDQWPPSSHRRIFFESEAKADESKYARQIIAKFMARAWRKSVSEAECHQKVQLFERIRRDCDSFEEAMIEVLASILSSPNFLYIIQTSDTAEQSSDSTDLQGDSSTGRPKLSADELATRLSMFLWCSVPDEELLQLAANERLLDAQVLVSQVTRMLADPRSTRFARHFVYQWLNMELLEFLNLNQHVPGFDPLLKEAMQYEPVALFEEMLRNNESVLNFIHANYTMANERLAKHYGIANVYGNQFRRVSLDGNFRRGGLLTQAGLLAMNSDFPDSHPLKRGKWLLVSLLNDPPPPPPPAVPQIDLANPEIAKMTLKERIEDHRNHAACMSCHIKIDPWGIAFENYDAVGLWREQIKDKPVDASSELFNQQKLAGMDGLKRFLLENRQDQFVGSVVHKVTTYALGRPLGFSDRADLEAISAQLRQQGDGLGTLLLTVATSDLFRSK